jgi:hypothetical protein
MRRDPDCGSQLGRSYDMNGHMVYNAIMGME